MNDDADNFGYTAYEKWAYRPVFFKTDNTRTWLGVREGYYEASLFLIKGIAKGEFNEDMEGVVAVFVFRHYLELSLKRIIVEGRWLKTVDENARKEDVRELNRTHALGGLWEKVLSDAMPKIPGDETDFVQKCVLEFDRVDRNGETFRYAEEGAENYVVSFLQLSQSMVHVHQVLEAIITYLVETYHWNRSALEDTL